MTVEVAFRVTGPIDALDRALLVARRGGVRAALRAMAAGLPLVAVVVGIWYFERVEGVRGLRPLFGLALATAWVLRAVLLARPARDDAKRLFPGLPMPEHPGRAVDVARAAGVTGLGFCFWALLLVLGLNADAIGVVAIAPLLCVRGAIAPGWVARAACTNEGGLRAFAGAFRDLGTRRASGLVVELLLILATLVLAVNLYAALAVAVMLGRVFLALDVASVDTFLGFRNVLVQMGAAAAALLALEPVRAALSAVWLVDARVRAEGLDLRAAVDRALEAGTPAGRARRAAAVTASAAVLALALGLGAHVAHAQDIGFTPATPPDAGIPDARDAATPAVGETSAMDDPADDAVREKVNRVLARPEFREFGDRHLGEGDAGVSDFIQRLLEWLIRWLRGREGGDVGVPSLPLPPPAVFVGFAILLALGLLGYLLATRLRERRGVAGDPRAPAAALDVREKPPDALLDEAGALAARGELRLALRALYLATLVALDRRRLIDFDPHRTNWHYLRKMPRGEARDLFSEFTRLFDHKWYGDEPVTKDEYESSRALAVRIVDVTRDRAEAVSA